MALTRSVCIGFGFIGGVALVLLSVVYVLFGMKCYCLHEEYLASLRR